MGSLAPDDSALCRGWQAVVAARRHAARGSADQRGSPKRGFRCAGACSRCSPCGRSIRKSSRTDMACWMSAMEIACTGKHVGTQAVNLWSFSMVAPVRDVPPACVASLILVPTELSSLINAGAVEARPMPANSARISRSTRPLTCFKTSNSFEPISALKSGSCTAAPGGPHWRSPMPNPTRLA